MEQNNTLIAVIGMAGRFPDAVNVREFWRNLASGHESLIEFSDQEMLDAGVAPQLLADPNYVKRGTVLEGAAMFDAGFFGFNPREAEIIDPQQRAFLECAWEALEDAGYAGDAAPESTGLFAGSSINSYLIHNLLSNPEVTGSVGGYQVMLASDKDFLATRAAYKLNLRGPAITVQTACSTSLVAVNLACQQLMQGSCAMALAGGVSLMFPEKSGYLYTEGMILSPDGRCRPFDVDGRGIRAGAGVALVVLKRLEDAIRDGDHVHAVIRGVGTNNDGSAKMGYTAPSVEGQARAIAAAQQMAGVEPESISYIEAHGTATVVGDPIEITALSDVFKAKTEKKQFCAIGSAKSNLGHLDAAAGVAGLIKTVLALEHKQIPPSLNFETPNPQIDFDNSPFFVNTELRPWTANGSPRRAGVSSFGIGGTNAHTILEEAPEALAQKRSWESGLITLSARSAEALDKATAGLGVYLRENPEVDLFDACYTLQVGRKDFPHRRALAAGNRESAIATLEARKPAARVWDGVSRQVIFLFSGQGSQYVRMGAQLYAADPTFRAVFDECAEILRPDLGVDLRQAVYGDDASAEALAQTGLTQPALFAVEYALARMWQHWGVRPAAMIGHSIGEYAAACIAGVFSLQDALKIVALRGRLMQQMPKGGMLALPMSAERARPLCTGGIELAAVNTPALCTVSGPDETIEQLRGRLEGQGIDCRKIHTSHAFHSASMEGVLEPFRKALAGIRLNAPTIPFASNLTGRRITETEATDPAYWAAHLRNTVLFADGLRELSVNAPILLEVGPGDVLTTFARQSGQPASEIVSSLPHPKMPGGDADHVLGALGRLWSAGVPVDWAAFHEHERLRRVPLPTYPFERQRYYLEPQQPVPAVKQSQPLTHAAGDSDLYYVPSWKRTPLPETNPNDSEAGGNTWLVFGNFGNASAAVLNALADTGRVALVNPGTDYDRVAAGVYTIVAGNRAHYGRLVKDLAADGYDPDRIVHLWNATAGAEAAEISDDTAFFSLLFLIQAFAEIGDSKSRYCVVVSDQVHAVAGTEKIVPEKAMCLAAARVVPQELGYLQIRAVDLPGDATPEQYRRYAANLLLEPEVKNGGRIIAYRGSTRWQQTYQPRPLDKPASDLPLRANGVYLITGGLGGVGLAIARDLAKRVNARLVLTTRSAFPGRADWEKWIAEHGEQHGTSKRIRELLEIEAAGGQVLVAVGDVADEPAMAAVVDQAHKHFGAINGILHAAGLGGDGVSELKTRHAAEAVLSPKVHGTRVIERVVASDRPDFLLLFSSVSAIVGGSIDYCAANLFLDAFAASRTALADTHVVAIGWGIWSEVGMALAMDIPENARDIGSAYIQGGIRSEVGVEALRTVLSTSLRRVAVVPHDLVDMLTRSEADPQPQDALAVAADQNLEPVLGDGTDDGFSATQQYIARVWKEMLGVQEVALDDNFFELGGHSLLGTGVLSRIRKQFGIAVPLRELFEAPTVRELADHVDTLLWASQGAGEGAGSEEREEIEL